MSLLDKARTFGNTFAFRQVGDKILGRVEERRTVLSDYGEVEMLRVRAVACVMNGEDKGGGGLWEMFCGSTYLRRFLQEYDPNPYDYIILRFTEERPSYRSDNATKVIVGTKKKREAVEEW
jgi:hypothetical protein